MRQNKAILLRSDSSIIKETTMGRLCLAFTYPRHRLNYKEKYRSLTFRLLGLRRSPAQAPPRRRCASFRRQVLITVSQSKVRGMFDDAYLYWRKTPPRSMWAVPGQPKAHGERFSLGALYPRSIIWQATSRVYPIVMEGWYTP